ncbi:MAG: glycosyltransferase [Oscillospiraceae bacterium]|nr:glycosyltransferase [Oscillospiraceae bacterium]
MNELKILTIIIPTYNRRADVCKNILMLNDNITKYNLQDKIKIIVSDNHSEDGTFAELLKIKNKIKIDLECIEQKQNIGGTNNSRFILKSVKTEFALLLGDDDYLDEKYLSIVVDYLEKRDDITAIVPNFYSNLSKNCRDDIGEDVFLHQGVNNLPLMFKAHQMSGLVFKVENVLSTLYERNGENEYYQAFCIGFNILRGTSIYITRNPVCVNVTNKKFWTYGKAGLWDDMFLNIKILQLTDKDRKKIERNYLYYYSWAEIPRLIKSPVQFMKNVFLMNNMTYSTKCLVLPLMFCSGIGILYRKKIKKLGKLYKVEI